MAPTLVRASKSRLPTRSEREWIEGTCLGDYRAFDEMFVAYADALCAYAHVMLRSREDAQEVVQDLFLWIWEHRVRWQVPGQLRTYLYRSVHNRAISKMRRRRVERFFMLRMQAHAPDVPEVVAPDAQARLETTELSAAVARAIEALPERARQVFLLSRQHSMSYAEIAEVLQIAPKTVENHMARALAGLRAALESWR